MKRLIVKRLLYVIGAVSLIALIGAIQPAMAQLQGPTQIPPHGLVFVDSDTGGEDDKEQWGRVGGRLYEFTVHQAGDYDQLMWQPFSAGISFDGEIDPPGETLTYSTNDAGTAVWTGETRVYRLGPGGYYWESVETEFRLTVKDIQNNLVPYSVTPAGLPLFDLMSLPLNPSQDLYFSAKLEMRARMPLYDSLTTLCSDYYSPPEPIESVFLPALNVFDCLHTHPDYDGLALTQFDHGFYYELQFIDLDLNEHDANMEERVGDVQATAGDTNTLVHFLYDEWTPRITGLNTDHAGIRDQLASLDGLVNNVYTTVSNLSFPELTSLVERVDRLPTNDFLFLMFGLENFIEDPELQGLFELVRDNSPLYQAILPLNDKADALQAAVDAINLDLGPVLDAVNNINLNPVLDAVAGIALDLTPVEAALQTNATAIQGAVNLLSTTADGISLDVNTTMGYAYNTDIAVANVDATAAAIQTAVGEVNTKADAMGVRLAELETAVGTLQASVEYQARLDIQLKDVQSENESKGKDAETIKSFLALFTENGMQVLVATGDVSVHAILDGGTPSAVLVPFVPTPIGGAQGVMRLDLDLTNFDAMPKVLLIEASYNGNPGTINGSKLFTVGLHTE